MWQDQPVAIARDLLAGEHRIAWPAPLVRWLRERSFGLALDWVFHITPELLRRAGTPRALELLGELDQLQRWRAAPPSSSLFRQKAEALWCRPNREVAHTAMSHLCMSLAQVVCPDLEVGVNWLWHVPSLLCDKDCQGQPRKELVEWCLADFEAFVASLSE